MRHQRPHHRDRLQGRSSDHVPRAGTPVYLAPETLGNKSGSVNEPVDVYRCVPVRAMPLAVCRV
jgi:hypothetical protein